MAKRELLLGDEALALGALHAGLSGVYAYPGTPSTEITEYIQQHPLAAQRNVHRTWSSNEKTAMEEALGMSFAGKRALVCMKHVGLNVAADAFVNSAMTGANGGLVVVAADDPSMHSSQNEQDSRFYGKFALMPTFEPADQQEAYDMAKAAFDLSERFRIPVLMRLTTRMAHSRAVVETGEARAENPLSPSRTAPPVGADAGKLARAIPNAAGGLRPAGRGVRRQPVQRLYGGSGQTAGHRRLRHRTQLPDGELPRRMSAPGAENRAVPAAPHAGAPYRRRVRHAADPRRGPAVVEEIVRACCPIPWRSADA